MNTLKVVGVTAALFFFVYAGVGAEPEPAKTPRRQILDKMAVVFSNAVAGNSYTYEISQKTGSEVVTLVSKLKVVEQIADKDGKVTAVKLTVEETKTSNEKTVTRSFEQTESLDQFAALFPDGVDYAVTQDTVKIGDRELVCLKAVYRPVDQDGTVTVWISDTDGTGIVKMEMAGKDSHMTMSLTVWESAK